MQIRQLEYFVAVAEQLNFTRAAQQFFVSQSAVTLQIKALEEELGVQLFLRDNRHVELTPAGRSYLDDVQAILQRTRDAADRARRASTRLTGHLALGIVKGYEKTELAGLLESFHIDFPNISLRMARDNVGELYEGILNGSLDFAWNLFYSPDDLADLEFRPLKTYPLNAVLSSSHPLAHRPFIRREELKGYPYIQTVSFDTRFGERESIMNTFAAAGFLPNTQYVSDDIEISLLAAAIGMGYSLLPSYITDSVTSLDNIVVIPLLGEEHQIRVIGCWKKGNKNPALKELLTRLYPEENA